MTVLLLVGAGFARLALACTMVYAPVMVGPNFRVTIEGDRRPVGGISVILQKDGRSVASGIASNNGVASFRDVPIGSYRLFASHRSGFSEDTAVEVRAFGSSNATVTLRWPGHPPPVAVGALKGRFYLADMVPGQPQPPISIELLAAASGRRLRNVQTSEDGTFDLSDAKPGLYSLRLRTEMIGDGLVAVEVMAGRAADLLELELGSSSCGFYFANRGACPQPHLHVKRLAGRVLDAMGAVIPGANVSLLSQEGVLAEQTRSDANGNFQAALLADGTYQLVIQSVAFTPVRTNVTIDSKGSVSPLDARLGVLGNCSSAVAK